MFYCYWLHVTMNVQVLFVCVHVDRFLLFLKQYCNTELTLTFEQLGI